MLRTERIAGTEPQRVERLLQVPAQRRRFAERNETAQGSTTPGNRGGVVVRGTVLMVPLDVT
jgi:hypothetical protein